MAAREEEDVDFEVDEEVVVARAAAAAHDEGDGTASGGALSTSRGGKKAGKIRVKGRGHEIDEADRYDGRGGSYETLDGGRGSGPSKCKLILRVLQLVCYSFV